jgi:hypothetical protein
VTLLFLFHQNEEKKFQKQLNACFKDLSILIENTNTHGLFVRLAWSDAVNYDVTVHFWPHCGGCNGSIRFVSELDEPANAGLVSAIDLLTPLKKRYDRISWADIIQMAGAVAIELCNGPQLDLQYGRLDVPVDLRNLSRKEELYYSKKWNKTGRIIPVDSEDIRNRILPQVFPPYPLGKSPLAINWSSLLMPILSPRRRAQCRDPSSDYNTPTWSELPGDGSPMRGPYFRPSIQGEIGSMSVLFGRSRSNLLHQTDLRCEGKPPPVVPIFLFS